MPDRTLIVLRHAKSDWSGDEDDVDRPLANRGRRQAPEAGAWLAANIDAIDLAVVSPALRARSTWELASAELAQRPETRLDDRVYGASASGLLGLVGDLPDQAGTVVVVGHNPGVAELVALLAGKWIEMPTSAIAVLEWSGSWSSVRTSGPRLRAAGRPPPPLSGPGAPGGPPAPLSP